MTCVHEPLVRFMAKFSLRHNLIFFYKTDDWTTRKNVAGPARGCRRCNLLIYFLDGFPKYLISAIGTYLSQAICGQQRFEVKIVAIVTHPYTECVTQTKMTGVGI